MEKITLPNLQQLKLQAEYVQFFSACTEILRTEYLERNVKDNNNTTAVEIMKRLMSVNAHKVNPSVQWILEIVKNSVFSLVNESNGRSKDNLLVFKNDPTIQNNIEQMLKSTQLFDKDDLNKMKKNTKDIQRLVHKYSQDFKVLEESKKKYWLIGNKIAGYKRLLRNVRRNLRDGTGDPIRNPLQFDTISNKLEKKNTEANLAFQNLKEMLKELHTVKENIKQAALQMKQQIKESLEPKLVIGLNDLKVVVGARIRPTSARSIIDEIEIFQKDHVMDSIINMDRIEYELNKVELNDLRYQPRTRKLRKSSSDTSNMSLHTFYDKYGYNTDYIHFGCVEHRNVYVQPQNLHCTPEKVKLGMKIKQKLYHEESKLSFGWQKDSFWNPKKTWVFFRVNDEPKV